MDYDGLLGLVEKRRSIRRFKPAPIPDEYIDKIIEVARWAPSGFNMQPWEFVVVKKPELKEKIALLIREYYAHIPRMEATREPWQGAWSPQPADPNDYSTAPVFILLFGDTRTQAGLPMALRFDPDRRQLIYTSSLANTFLYMHLAAAALGLASQWVSGVRRSYAHCLIKDLLGIPRELEVYDMMALGYPAVAPRTKFMRDKKEMVHYDDCGEADFRTEKQVNDFIRRARTWTIATMRRAADQSRIGVSGGI